MADMKPYDTVRGLLGPLDSWLSGEDAVRLAAYATYENIYRNSPDAFKLIHRGSEAHPIYLPNARTIIETVHRHLARSWNYSLDPEYGTDADRAALGAVLQPLFRRELMWTKFSTQKRFGLIRGDQVWHVVADPDKPAGRRLSIYELDPASYFPITDDWNPDMVLGCHIVDPVENADGQTIIKRQTYRKTSGGTISYQLSWWETGAWDDREGGKLKRAAPPDRERWNQPVEFELPEEITSLPVYHIKNSRTPGQIFGESELQGFEVLIGAVNQAITDQDLALVLQGLGLYATTSGPPVDDDDNETDWHLGPGVVVEIDADSSFERVSGVSSVAPSLEHIAKIEGSMREAAGIPDVAIGSVDVQTAESGVALALRMGPIIDKTAEKELEILGVTDHLLFDLSTMWLPVYEGVGGAARAVSVVGDALPTNRKAVLDEILALLHASLITIPYAQQLVAERLGYDFPADMLAEIISEQRALAEARDPYASRVAGELDGA